MAKTNKSATLDNDRFGAGSGTDSIGGGYDSGSSYDTGGNSSGGGSAGIRGRASGATQKASQQINNSPLIAVGAGAALGAVLGAVLPASRKEKELLRPLGSKLTTAGSGAVERARDMSKQKFDEMAGDKFREFLGMGGGSSGSSGGGSSGATGGTGGSSPGGGNI